MRSHPHPHAHLHAFCCGIPAPKCLRVVQVETEFSLLLEENPLTDLVELPEELRGLKSSPPCPARAIRAVDQPVRARACCRRSFVASDAGLPAGRYCNVLCGVIRGAMEMVNMRYARTRARARAPESCPGRVLLLLQP
jgi:hypothetical protein